MKTCAKLFVLGLLTIGATFSGVRSSEAGITGDLIVTNNHDFVIYINVWRSHNEIVKDRAVQPGKVSYDPRGGYGKGSDVCTCHERHCLWRRHRWSTHNQRQLRRLRLGALTRSDSLGSARFGDRPSPRHSATFMA